MSERPTVSQASEASRQSAQTLLRWRAAKYRRVADAMEKLAEAIDTTQARGSNSLEVEIWGLLSELPAF